MVSCRSTYDTDLLTVSPACLERATWRQLEALGSEVDIRVGDDDDPLLGVVRVTQDDETIDVVVGRSAWQRGILQRAVVAKILKHLGLPCEPPRPAKACASPAAQTDLDYVA